METDLQQGPQQTAVSVVVPVYNGEHFLRRCLDSVLGQTFQDFELLVVNDGSTDSTRDILSEYEGRPETIRVIDQENQGQGAARNRGIEASSGRYVLFVDADDYIESVALQVLVERADRDRSELVHFDWKLCESTCSGEENPRYFNAEPFWQLRDLRGAECELLYRMTNYFSVTNLYRREFLLEHGIRYPEGMIYEDNPFLTRVISSASHVSLLHSPLYNVQLNSASLTKTGTQTDRHMRDHLKAVRMSFEEICPRTPGSKEDLALYHLEKFSFYLRRRIPRKYRGQYARELLEVVGSHVSSFQWLGRKAGWLGRLSMALGILRRRRAFLLRAIVELRDAAAVPGRTARTFVRRISPVLRHPAREAALYRTRHFKRVGAGTVMFLGFDGKFSGSSRALFEELLAEEGVHPGDVFFATEDTRVPRGFRVKPQSSEFFEQLGRTEFVVAESWVAESIPKLDGATWIQLWHGTPAKRMLFDSHERQITTRRPKHKAQKFRDIQRWDYFVVGDDLSAERFASGFLFPKERMIHTSSPMLRKMALSRNRVLAGEPTSWEKSDQQTKVVLYAPTWRDSNYGLASENRTYTHEIDLHEFSAALGDGFTILYKGHTYLRDDRRLMDISGVVDVTSEDISDVLPHCDLLITDYSSVAFDATKLGIEVVLYQTDRCDFERDRGLYVAPWGEEDYKVVGTVEETVDWIFQSSGDNDVTLSNIAATRNPLLEILGYPRPKTQIRN